MKRLIALLLFATVCVCAAEDDIPAVVRTGFDAYATKGAEAAWTSWGLEGGQKAIGQVPQWTAEDKTKFVAALSGATKTYGKVLGYELIRTFDVAPSYKTIHILWRFEKKPLFCMFVCYRGADDWRIVNFFFGSDPREFLPDSISGMPPPRK